MVPDVDAFPGHIACASSTRSELVLPVRNQAGDVIAVFDIDSDQPDAFGEGQTQPRSAPSWPASSRAKGLHRGLIVLAQQGPSRDDQIAQPRLTSPVMRIEPHRKPALAGLVPEYPPSQPAHRGCHQGLPATTNAARGCAAFCGARAACPSQRPAKSACIDRPKIDHRNPHGAFIVQPDLHTQVKKRLEISPIRGTVKIIA